MVTSTIKHLRFAGVASWRSFAYRLASTSAAPSTGVVREVLGLQLNTGQAAQACVTFTQLNSNGGTQAAQAAWQAVVPVLKGLKPTFVVVQTSANHQTASAATRLVHAQLKALSGSSNIIPSVVGFTTKPWTPVGDTLAAAKLTCGLWKLQRHLRITAVALQDIESTSFHAVSDSFPVIPKLQEALTLRPPHVILLPHPSFDFVKLSSLIERLESGFQGAQVLGTIPLPPLPDQDLPTAKRELETFRSEAGAILGEANAADDLTAPLAVAAAEAESLTLAQLEGPVEEAEVLGGQEEAAIFMEDTSFMQGAVGLTLMPSALSTRVPDADLAALARLIFGSDKLFGFFLSSTLKQQIYVPRDQESSIAPPSDEDIPTSPLLTEADLIHFGIKQTSASSSSQDSTSGSSSPSSSLSPLSSASLPPATADAAESAQLDSSIYSQTAALSVTVQTSTSQAVSAATPQQAAQEQAAVQKHVQAHAEAKVQAQAQAQGKLPPSGQRTIPADAAPVSTLGLMAAAGTQQGRDSQLESASGPGLLAQDWQAANAVPEGLVLQPSGVEIGARLLQTPTQLPVFAVDSVLWPNQIMMLRVFEPRYRRLVKCCQDSNGCFAIASYGVGITAMFDRVHTEEDTSNSVAIRGGRRFLVQEGSARVVPGTFGLTVVEPCYIYDTDLDSPEVAALAAQAADLLTRAHAAAVEDAANSQSNYIPDAEEAAEDAASRWREGVLEDEGASSAFADVFNLNTKARQSSAPSVAPVRQHWSPAASQELSFLLGTSLPVPTTMRRKWLEMTSLTRRLKQQVELLRESRPRVIVGGILEGLPDDSRFHELLYQSESDVKQK